MSTQMKSQPGRRAPVLALALLMVCLLFLALGLLQQQPTHAQDLTAPAAEDETGAKPVAVPESTPCPYQGTTDPPPGQWARLIGDEEILLSYRFAGDPRSLRNIVLNDVNGSLSASTSESAWSQVDEVRWLACDAVDLNGDRKAEVVSAYKDHSKHIGAMANPIGTTALPTDNVDWVNIDNRTAGDSVADVDVATGNLDPTDDNDEAVVAFRDDYQDLHLQVLNGSTTGYFQTADNPATGVGQVFFDSEERGNIHHTAVATGDLNKDGTDEIVVAFKDSGNDLEVMVLQYQSDGTFKVLHRYDSYSATPKFDTVADTDDGWANKRPIDVTTGDLDYDLQDEIIVAFRYGNGDTGEIQLLVEDVKSVAADGTLTMDAYVTKKVDLKGSHYNYGANVVSVAAADLDGDGYDEIALGYTLIWWDANTYVERKWQHRLVTYEYLPVGTVDWKSKCDLGKPDYNGGLSCLVARVGSWSSSSVEVPYGTPENNPPALVTIGAGDLDRDGMAEIGLARYDFDDGDVNVRTFDADAGLAQRTTYDVDSGTNSIWELWLAMEDYDGDSVWGEYTGNCYWKKDALVQSVIHAPPFWPEEEHWLGCENAHDTAAGAGRSATDTQGTGDTVENTIGGSTTLDLEIKGISGGFTREWEESTAQTTTQMTTTVQGTGVLTLPPVSAGSSEPRFEAVQLGESHNWCYDYTEATLGTMPVCVPDGTYGFTGKYLDWWYRDGPATYGDSWVPLGMNLAQGRQASQSSDYASETPPGKAVAAWAVDGNTNGDFYKGSVAQTGSDLYAWWQVDLGGLQWIDAVQLWNRTDCCSQRLANFWVLATEGPEWPTTCSVGGVTCNCGDPACLKDQEGVWGTYIAGPVGESLVIPVNGYGRLLRVQLDHKDWLQLAEVQVYGMPGTPDQWPMAAPEGTIGSGDTFKLTWRNAPPQQVGGRLYYAWPRAATLSTGPGSTTLPFNLGLGHEEGNVTESGQSQKQSVGFGTRIRSGERATEISVKHSSESTWEASVDLNGQATGLPDCEYEDAAYDWAPYVWRQEVTSPGGLTQKFLVLDYYVPSATEFPVLEVGPTGVPEAAPSSGPAPQAPLIESPSHPDPNAWYADNTATFAWTQPPGDPAIESYDWFLGRSPDTIPAGSYRGLTTTKTWEGLADGTWYLHVRAMSDGGVWGDTGHRMIRVDAQPPQVSLALDPPNPTGDGGWYVSPVTVSVSADDQAGSGVARVEVSTDGAAWQLYTAPLVFSADSPGTTIYGRAWDAIGHVSEPVTTTVKLDRTPPDSHVDGGAGPGVWTAEVVTNSAGNQEVVLSGAVDDDLSGRAGIDLGYDGVDRTGPTAVGSWHPFPNLPQIVVNWHYTPTHQIGAGYHIFTGQAFDVAGNRETAYEIGRIKWFPRAAPDIAGSSLTASPATARPGEAVTFTLVARNAGWQEAHVSIVDTLPEGLTPLLDTLPAGVGYDAATRTLTWPDQLLWPGWWVQHVFQARVDVDLAATRLENRATFHAFWPNTDLLPAAERQQFVDRERTAIATAIVVVNPNLSPGADVTPPWVFLVQPYHLAVEGPEMVLAIPAAPDATRMYLREWTPDPATGAWVVRRSSGWIAYSRSHTWALSSGQGVKYIGVWAADGAGNVSTLDEHSLIFVNRIDGSQVLGDGQRVQYRGLVQGGEWISGILASLSGDPDLYMWMPRHAFWPDRRFTEILLPGQVETFSNQFRLEGGRYLLEVQAVGASEYELSLTGQGGTMAAAGGATMEKPLPPHPLTVSDPLSAGQLGPEVGLYTKWYLPLMFKDQ